MSVELRWYRRPTTNIHEVGLETVLQYRDGYEDISGYMRYSDWQDVPTEEATETELVKIMNPRSKQHLTKKKKKRSK